MTLNHFIAATQHALGLVSRSAANAAKQIDFSSALPDRNTILCIDRSQFSKDIEELRRLTALNWITLDTGVLKHAQEKWVPLADREQGYFTSWVQSPRASYLRPLLEEFGEALLMFASKNLTIDAVATANIDYWQDEAIKLGCERLGIPFLVISRENYTIPFTIPWKHNHIAKSGFELRGQGVAVFSEATKLAISPAVRNPDDIWVTGAPRYDRWLDIQPVPLSDKKHMTLITFNDPGYMGSKVFGEVAEIFSQVAEAKRSLGLTWLVKCKKRGDRDEVLNRVDHSQTANLTFEYDIPLFEVFPCSRIVVGYNSLALVEALLTDAPLIIPRWGETDTLQSKLLFDFNDPNISEIVTFARSPQDLAAIMNDAADGKQLKTGTPEQRRRQFLAHIHIPKDTTASAKVEAFVNHYIQRARNR